jgi:hypothetical protein
VTRHLFGGDIAAWTTDLGDSATSQSSQAGNLALFIPNAVIAFWSAQTGGSLVTDLLDSLGTPASTISSDANGEIPTFSGPDTSPDETLLLWADGSGDGSGPRRAMLAIDLGDTVNANRQTLLDLTSTANELQTLAASSLGIVEYDTATSSWPDRPSDSRIYMWVGPSAPTTGGTGMQDGRDFWLNPTPVA